MSRQDYIYGLHTVKALLKNSKTNVVRVFLRIGRNDQRLAEISSLAKLREVPVNMLTAKELDVLTAGGNHQGVAAAVKKDFESVNTSKKNFEEFIDKIAKQAFLLILDGVQDPHNLGACLRTANAAGVHAVIAPKDNAAGLTSVVRKVALGAAESTPFFQITNLVHTIEFLKQKNIWIYGTSDKAKESIYECKLSLPLAIIMGAEGQGLRRLTQEHCDFLVKIPMFGDVPNLNVSVAAGICLFEAVRSKLYQVK